MGLIREPEGVDFVVEPATLTEEDRKFISAVIAYYKATGRKLSAKKYMTIARTSEKTAYNMHVSTRLAVAHK